MLVLKTQPFLSKNEHKNEERKNFFMVFKWFNMMIKARQKCGANYEIMQINEKYSVERNETKQKEIKI